MPLSAAGETLGFVDADQFAAPWAGPLLFLVSDEVPYTGGLYVREIFDLAHAARSDRARGYSVGLCRFCHICIQKPFTD